MGKLDVSERRVCRVIGQPRSTQRDRAVVKDDEGFLGEEIIRLANRNRCARELYGSRCNRVTLHPCNIRIR
jgi:hypothetical protein